LTSDRDTILTAIRKALLKKTDPAVRSAEVDAMATDVESLRGWLPETGGSYEEYRRLFADNAAALQADFQVVPDQEAMLDAVRRIARAEGWSKIGAHRGRLTDAVCDTIGLPVCHTNRGYAVDDLESCDAGITECEALIAQTGSVLVTCASSGGRALTVLPPHHVVLATRDQMLPDISAGYELIQRKYRGGYPSFISLITGPSRTGDIERILVLGAHGPKKLTVLLVETPASEAV
jgi:L-lactate dehydrogenase complex protein LldG